MRDGVAERAELGAEEDGEDGPGARADDEVEDVVRLATWSHDSIVKACVAFAKTLKCDRSLEFP